MQSYADRLAGAKEIAQKISSLCESYQQLPSQTTMNHFLAAVEQLADIAEDIEAEQLQRALDD